MAVVGGWILFGFTMSKWSQSRKAKRLASEPPAQPPPPEARPSSSSAKKHGHH
jgi:hypothetical protein